MHRSLVRIIVNTFKGIKEVSASSDAIYYKCLKCGGELIAHRGYGKLRLLCKCGHAANVYTGKDIHFKSDVKQFEEHSVLSKDELQIEVFDKHIKSDLGYLYNVISDKRDITKQVYAFYCIDMLDGEDQRCREDDTEDQRREGYEKIFKYLQTFCDLESASLHLVWEPLNNPNTLSSIENRIDILGTTYFLSLNSILWYTVYLNPKFISNSYVLLATIAHELSHVYACHNNIQFASPDNDRGNKAFSEQMTDLLGIVLGMGNLICTPITTNESFTTGYLTSDMISKSYNLWKSDYLSGKNKDIKTLAICNQCSQKLKVPISKKKVRLICPKCKLKFEYKQLP